MSSLSPLHPGRKSLCVYCLPAHSSHTIISTEEKEGFFFSPATDFSSVKSSIGVGCWDHYAQIVPYPIIMGQTSPASLWLFSTCNAWHVSFLPPLQSPSLLANLVKNLLLSSKLFWHHLFLEVSPDPSKEDLSIHSLQKPHPLWPLLLMCLMSSTCIFISMIVCLLSQGRKLYPIQLWQFRSGILHPDFTLKSPGEL